MSLSQTKISTRYGPELRGGNISLDNVLKKDTARVRQTKIICTLGPACWSVEMLEQLIDAGMTVARFNFSHGDYKTHQDCYDRLKIASTNKKKHIAVMLDTKGPEIRTGFFQDDLKKINVVKGETIILTSDYTYKGNEKKLACSYTSLATSVNPGQQILIADGSLVLTVLTTDPTHHEVECRIENNASIGERKNMNLPGVIVDLPTLTDKDKQDILEWGIPNHIDIIAASFVRKPSDVIEIRTLLGDIGKDIKIICKIENQEGLQNYDEILEVTDGIMVARGDMGMEIPPQKVFLAQKMMIRKANIVGKPVVTATQMLESMITNPRPTRAECSDVANAVLDGTDCVMLSGETANGDYPVAAVQIMGQTCIEAESTQDTNLLYESIRQSALKQFHEFTISESIASSAVKTAIDVKAKAIIVVSESGTTVRQVAKFRPGRPIYCITANQQVARQVVGILRSAEAICIDHISQMENAIYTLIETLLNTGKMNTGDAVVIITGTVLQHEGGTNLMRIHYA